MTNTNLDDHECITGHTPLDTIVIIVSTIFISHISNCTLSAFTKERKRERERERVLSDHRQHRDVYNLKLFIYKQLTFSRGDKGERDPFVESIYLAFAV